jgi:hypothetical protein
MRGREGVYSGTLSLPRARSMTFSESVCAIDREFCSSASGFWALRPETTYVVSIRSIEVVRLFEVDMRVRDHPGTVHVVLTG